MQYDSEDLKRHVDVTQIPLSSKVYVKAMAIIKKPMNELFQESDIQNPFDPKVLQNLTEQQGGDAQLEDAMANALDIETDRKSIQNLSTLIENSSPQERKNAAITKSMVSLHNQQSSKNL